MTEFQVTEMTRNELAAALRRGSGLARLSESEVMAVVDHMERLGFNHPSFGGKNSDPVVSEASIKAGSDQVNVSDDGDTRNAGIAAAETK